MDGLTTGHNLSQGGGQSKHFMVMGKALFYGCGGDKLNKVIYNFYHTENLCHEESKKKKIYDYYLYRACDVIWPIWTLQFSGSLQRSS